MKSYGHLKLSYCLKKYGMCLNNTLVIDGLLAELIQINKGSGRYFHTKTDNNFNHCIEVSRGNSAPDARALAKS